jgi:hypothetical protein
MAGKQTVGVGSPWSGEFPERKTRLFSGPDNPAFPRLFDVFRAQRIDWRGALGGQELRGRRNGLGHQHRSR